MLVADRLPVRHQRRRVGRRRGPGEAREGPHARGLRRPLSASVATAGLVLVPTFVAFTPWTTLDGYRDLLETVEALDLVEHVAPVQWGLRLLVTEGSRLLELDDIRAAGCAVRSADADVSMAPRGPARRRAAAGHHAARRRAHDSSRAGGVRRRSASWRAGCRRAPVARPRPSPSLARRFRISTSLGTVERSPTQSRWLWSNERLTTGAMAMQGCRVRTCAGTRRFVMARAGASDRGSGQQAICGECCFWRRRPGIRPGCSVRRPSGSG